MTDTLQREQVSTHCEICGALDCISARCDAERSASTEGSLYIDDFDVEDDDVVLVHYASDDLYGDDPQALYADDPVLAMIDEDLDHYFDERFIARWGYSRRDETSEQRADRLRIEEYEQAELERNHAAGTTNLGDMLREALSRKNPQ